MNEIPNCWDIKKCGRGPDGDHSCAVAGATPCAGINRGRNGGRVCWAVAGTLCGGVVQGTSAQKIDNCINCEVFHRIRREEGPNFCVGADVLVRLADTSGLETSYLRLIETFADLKRMSAELLHSQKLAAIGTLAAGIAHEINTPAQYVGDSIQFLSESFESARVLIGKYREMLESVVAVPGHEGLAKDVEEAEQVADFSYIEQNMPGALERAVDGISRISTIVSAMRDFAHVDRCDKSKADINRALLATLTIAGNEYRYVADVETELGELPPVLCHLGDINQVFLNLVVNAAHAISDVVGKGGTKGCIRVRTSSDGAAVRIEIGDTGCGIPKEIRDRVFDPFFTTKDVGRGSGQGLAIARSIVVNKHGGSLTFESEVGKGTTFSVVLPVDPTAAGVPESPR